MHDYSQVKKDYGRKVSQTTDSPIMIFDFLELGDAFAAIGGVLIFGVLFYSLPLLLLSLVTSLVAVPIVKKHNHRGIFFHWSYRHLSMTLPGIVNPGKNQRYSD